ncbi:MAG: TlpA family protein disulfide reductase [Acidobacteriia bacterium]|nr:TlpA family protein disulfide reductase [Terriglobia bacterium]
MSRRFVLLIVVAVLAIGVYEGFHRFGSHKAVMSLSNLSAAPQFSAKDINGGSVNMPDYKGKVVLVNFWAAWCTPCAEEVPQFIALQKKYQDQGLQVVGVSVDDNPEVLLRFYRKYQMNYPVVAGDLKIADGFGGVLGLPTTFLIGRDSRIHSKHNGTADFSVIEREVVALLHAPQS